MAKALNVSLAVTADTSQARQQLQQLQQSLQQLSTSSANLKIGISSEEIQKASRAALELSAHLKTATNVNTGTLDFTKLNSSIKSSGQSLESYSQQLLKLGPQGRQAFMQLAQSVAKSEIPIKRLSGLLGNMGTVLANTIRWQLSSSMIHGFMNAISTAYGYAKDLNKSLNNIQIVTEMSDSQMAKFAESANKAAKALSTTTTSYTDAALIYYQQGIRDQKEIAERTDATIKMANVTGQSAEQVSNQMTAIWNNFAKGGENLEYYADVITALGAATASSSAEIAQGLEKFAAIANTVGLSYENATAALATITATTRQSADTVGTGLRTLFSRLQSLKLGDTLEDGVDLTKYTKALRTVGVEALDAQGNLRQMDDVLADLGEKWQDLSQAQKVALAQTVGGVRQYTTLMALMENNDFFKENQKVAASAEGTLERQQQIYEKSWAAAAKRVRASAESIYSSLIDDQFFTKLTDNFAKFLDILNNVIAGLGGMKGILLSLGGILTSTFSNQVAAGLYKFGTGIRDMFTSPRALAAKRDAFVSNAAGIYAGLPIDSKTGYIKGAVLDKKTGQLDVTNVSMSTSQKQMYSTMASQMAVQQAYSRNANFMTPEQQFAAQMAMDQQARTADLFMQAQQKNKQSQQAVGAKVSDLYGQIMSSNKKGSLGHIIANKGTYTMPDGTTVQLDNDLASQILDTARTNFETKDSQYAQALAMLGKMERGEMSATDLTSEQRSLLGLGESPLGAGQIEAKRAEFEKARQANRFEAQQQFTKLGGSSQAFSTYANAYQQALGAGMSEKEAKEAAAQAQRNAEELAKKTSAGMKVAQGATNVAAGFMSISAAQASFESLTNTIQQANDGLISTKEAATQGISAISSMAMNGVRAFQSFSAVLGPIGGIIATIASAALPYIINWIDGLFETDAEKLERLTKDVEEAQEKLNEAQQNANNVITNFEGHNALLDEINNLTVGTNAFNAALIEANASAQELIKQYDLIEGKDYYTDRNGIIHFDSMTQTRVQKEEDKKVAQAEYNLKLAEFVKENFDQNLKIEKDLSPLINFMQKIDEREKYYKENNIAYERTHGTNIREINDTSGKSNINLLTEFTDEELYNLNDKVKEYGFASLGDFFSSYSKGISNVGTRIGQTHGMSEPYANLLRSKIMSEKGEVTSLDEIKINVLKDLYNPISLDVDDYNLNKIETSSKKTIDLTTTNGYTDRYTAYKEYLKEELGEEQSLQALGELLNSEAWKAASNETEKSILINADIKRREKEKLVNDIIAKNNVSASFFEGVDTSKYEDFQDKTLAELSQDRRRLRVNGKLLDSSEEITKAIETGQWIYTEGEHNETRLATNDEIAQAQVDLAIMQQLAQEQAEATSNLGRTLIGQTNLNLRAGAFKTLGSELTINELNTLSTYVNEFSRLLGEDAGGYIAAELASGMLEKNSDFKDAIDSIDWSESGIENLFNLKNAAQNLDDQSALKQQLIGIAGLIDEEIGGPVGLLQELYGSEGFSGTLESLQKEFKSTGKISAKSISDAAEECELLAKFLDLTQTNAQGLADTFEAIEIGDIGIDQVTQGLINAYSAAGALQNNLTEVFDNIDNFTAQRSIADIGEHYVGRIKQIQESLDKIALRDPALLQAWEEVLGPESLSDFKEWGREISALQEKLGRNLTPDEINASFNERFASEVEVLNNILETGNLSHMFEYVFEQAGKTATTKTKAQIKDTEGNLIGYADKVGQIFDAQGNALMHFDKETGQVIADNDKLFQQTFKTQDDFIKYLTNSLNVPLETAKAMAAELTSYSPAIEDFWTAAGAFDGYEKLVESLNKEDLNINAAKAFYNSYKDVFQLLEDFEDIDSFDKFKEKLLKDTEQLSHSIIDLGDDFDYANSSYEELTEAMSDYGNPDSDKSGLQQYLDNNTDSYWLSKGNYQGEEYETGEAIKHRFGDAKDIKELQKAYMGLGYSASQANEMIDESGVRLVGQARALDGTLETITDKNFKYLEYLQNNSLQHTAENFQAYLDYTVDLAQTHQTADIYADSFAKKLTNIPVTFNGDNLQTVINDAEQRAKDTDIEIKYHFTATNELPTGAEISGEISPASGYNNAKGFAGGKHSNGQYEGLAEVGELGPELWIHDNQAALAGIHGRTQIYIHPDDTIYTAAQTQTILNNNPSMSDIPGFYTGYGSHGITLGTTEEEDTNADIRASKEANYEPERYHLITRQLKDLQREYDRLNKLKENCYGTNKLEAIQREIDATKELIEGQKRLIKETEDYLKIDAGRLKGMLAAGEFQVDANGNLLNFEDLQEKYRKQAETKKDAEGNDLNEDELKRVTDIWKALQQYEETVDKLQDANVEMQDLLYQEMELRLEKITTKVDMRIDFDEREIKLLDHYIKRIDDNIYHTAEVLALTEQKLGHINQKIEDTKVGITELFEQMSDSEGNLITKEDGSAYTLEDWLAMSKEERDQLDINDNFGKQLEEYTDNLLDYIEELEEFKTKGVEEFGEAFSELNDNVRSSIDLFDHYNSLLSSLKNITDLQGVKLSAEMKATLKAIDQAMFNNTQNNIDAERENYRRLTSQVADLRQKVTETQDETLKKQWEEQLKTAEEELRTSEQNMLSLWETGLQQARDMFESALEEAASNYEATIAGMYGDTEQLQKAWDLKKNIDDIYVKDYEKYYQISKLQRSITRDLDAAARSGNKQNQGLKRLYDELNAKRASGVELSEYDLDIFAKRYEYEKALMELEDARNSKNEVRLQRDANGNWGYVYTSGIDEDELSAKQQAVDDKLYEWQKATQEGQNKMVESTMSSIQEIGKELQELYQSGASPEVIQKRVAEYKELLDRYKQQLQNALRDADMTEDIAKERYGEAMFDIIDTFDETLFSDLMNEDNMDEFFQRIMEAMDKADAEMGSAATEYGKQMDAINEWFNESGEDLATVIHGFASIISQESDDNLLDSKEQIQNAKDTFDEILKAATDFEQRFIEIYQPIIDANEQLVEDLLKALHALNREEYEGPDHGYSDYGIGDMAESAETIYNNLEDAEESEGDAPYSCPHFNQVWKEFPVPGSEFIRLYCPDCGKWLGRKKKKLPEGSGGGGGGISLIAPYSTGGYTGVWGSDGRIAILHEKELVLNKDDTENFLQATNILRTLDTSTKLFSRGFNNMINPWITDRQDQILEQNVHIEANFPNAQEHHEIELALENLVNKASQYANRKNMSSMTFNDMYINKF